MNENHKALVEYTKQLRVAEQALEQAKQALKNYNSIANRCDVLCKLMVVKTLQDEFLCLRDPEFRKKYL